MNLKSTSISLTVLIPGLVIPFALAMVIPTLFGQQQWPNIPLHSMLEGAGAFLNLSLAIYILILVRAETLPVHFNWAGASFLAMAILGSFHGSVVPGHTFVGLHSLGVLVGGLLFAGLALPLAWQPTRWLSQLPVFAAVLGLVLSLMLVLTQQAFPLMLHIDAFSDTAVMMNLIGGTGFFIATLALTLCKTPSLAHKPLAVMTLLYTVAAVLFEYSTLWDATWWLWHFLRFFALVVLLLYFFVWFHQQAKQTRNHAQMLESIAFKDPLTQLPNRALFYQQLKRELDVAKRNKASLALLYIDLDQFKNVNDSLGHEYGDALLKQVAQRLLNGLRDADLLARMGGDEFTVILNGPQTDATAGKVAQNLVDAVKPPYDVLGHQVEIGASIGIAFYPRDTQDLSTLMRLADSAMYQAKNSGRNRYHIYRDSTAS